MNVVMASAKTYCETTKNLTYNFQLVGQETNPGSVKYELGVPSRGF
jgi:hypothetical protein